VAVYVAVGVLAGTRPGYNGAGVIGKVVAVSVGVAAG
jgi:hypothetical protein